MKTLQLYVLERFMSPDEMKSLLGAYKKNLKGVGKSVREVTDLDRRIAQEYREGRTISELSKFYKIGYAKVLYSIALALK